MAGAVRYAIEHVSRYRYASRVRRCAMLLCLEPRGDRGQRLLHFAIETRPPGGLSRERDSFGNVRHVLDVHEGHMVYLKPGEERFVFPQVLERSLVGTGPEIIEKIEHLESIGVDNIALTANDPAGAREIIDDFSREVIQKRG